MPLEQKLKEWAILEPIFLTTTQEKRKSLLSKNAKDNNVEILKFLENWQNHFIDLVEKIANYKVLETSAHLFEITKVFLEKYQTYKDKTKRWKQ